MTVAIGTIKTAVCKKIRAQFPDTPEGALWYTVLEGAIRDLNNDKARNIALVYIKSEMIGVQLCGVDPDWIRRLLIQAGIITRDDLNNASPKRCTEREMKMIRLEQAEFSRNIENAMNEQRPVKTGLYRVNYL